ncbi:MAG: ribbon-helix-helix protein, CopG family [Deltaproteobacteria bacterium]|nr:ribbon-helix-helix protein, CopG family [Deltaproteobacteria bacterium]
MVRTQIYLTEAEHAGLRMLAERTGKTQSELIRIGVDRLLEEQLGDAKRNWLRRARGMWRDRADLPDFRTVRREWDRE